jgi:hypothetical protein
MFYKNYQIQIESAQADVYHAEAARKFGIPHMEFRQTPLFGIPRNFTEFNADSDGSSEVRK